MNFSSIKQMVSIGWPILSVLSACSLVSIAVILERWFYFSRRKLDIKDCLIRLPKVMSSGNISALGEPLGGSIFNAIQGGQGLTGQNQGRGLMMQLHNDPPRKSRRRMSSWHCRRSESARIALIQSSC